MDQRQERRDRRAGLVPSGVQGAAEPEIVPETEAAPSPLDAPELDDVAPEVAQAPNQPPEVSVLFAAL